MAKCLVCDKELVLNNYGTPNDGTLWKSTGGFSSGAYDSHRNTVYLVMYVCDECLLKKKDSVIERIAIEEVKTKIEDKPWTPGILDLL